MPKIYQYLGMVFYFWANEHPPIHVHVQYGSYESIFELITENGKVTGYKRRRSKVKELPPAQLKSAEKLISKMKTDIAKKWIDYFVYKKNIKIYKISKI